MHINFQCAALHACYTANSSFKNTIYRWYHRMLMHITILLTWHYHGHVLKAGGYPLPAYKAAIQNEYTRSRQMIEGKCRIYNRNLLQAVTA